MSSEFKYLVNPRKEAFEFQYNSEIFEVPAESKKLFLREVAEHGERRSYVLTDPKYDEDGNVTSTGNDVLKYCYTEQANTVNPVGQAEPILVEKSKDRVEDAADLLVDRTVVPPHIKPQSTPKKPHTFRQGDMPVTPVKPTV